jgi:glucose-1-phosphate thymidylyltransferase
MKAIILTAGFATRLGSFSKDIPKPLLNIKGKPVINYIIEKIIEVKEIDEIIIVTNNKYYDNFVLWSKNNLFSIKIDIINDNVNHKEEKLGMVGDLIFSINKKNLEEDFILIGGDTYFEFSLVPIVNFFHKKDGEVLVFNELVSLEEAQRFGVALIDENNKITQYEEKKAVPISKLACGLIFLFKKETLNFIREFDKLGLNKDISEQLISLLVKEKKVYAYVEKEKYTDIGTLDSLKRLDPQTYGNLSF